MLALQGEFSDYLVQILLYWLNVRNGYNDCSDGGDGGDDYIQGLHAYELFNSNYTHRQKYLRKSKHITSISRLMLT